MVLGAQIMFGSFFLTMLHMMDKPEGQQAPARLRIRPT